MWAYYSEFRIELHTTHHLTVIDQIFAGPVVVYIAIFTLIWQVRVYSSLGTHWDTFVLGEAKCAY